MIPSERFSASSVFPLFKQIWPLADNPKRESPFPAERVGRGVTKNRRNVTNRKSESGSIFHRNRNFRKYPVCHFDRGSFCLTSLKLSGLSVIIKNKNLRKGQCVNFILNFVESYINKEK